VARGWGFLALAVATLIRSLGFGTFAGPMSFLTAVVARAFLLDVARTSAALLIHGIAQGVGAQCPAISDIHAGGIPMTVNDAGGVHLFHLVKNLVVRQVFLQHEMVGIFALHEENLFQSCIKFALIYVVTMA
jgi:hypothetical protein